MSTNPELRMLARDVRLMLGYTWAQLAAKLGVSRTTLWHLNIGIGVRELTAYRIESRLKQLKDGRRK